MFTTATPLTDGVDMVGQPRKYEVGGDGEQDLFDSDKSNLLD